MNDTISFQLCLDENLVAVPTSRLAERVRPWLTAALGGTTFAAILVFAVATRSGAEAERLAGAGGSYAATLVSAMAVSHARRLP